MTMIKMDPSLPKPRLQRYSGKQRDIAAFALVMEGNQERNATAEYITEDHDRSSAACQ